MKLEQYCDVKQSASLFCCTYVKNILNCPVYVPCQLSASTVHDAVVLRGEKDSN